MRLQFIEAPCEIRGRTFRFKTLGFWDALPVCRDCGKVLEEGQLCYVCRARGYVRCEACELEDMVTGPPCTRMVGAHGHTPVWVNLEREAKFGEDEKHESSR